MPSPRDPKKRKRANVDAAIRPKGKAETHAGEAEMDAAEGKTTTGGGAWGCAEAIR